MSKHDNGGPAFPCMPPQDTGTGSAAGYPHPDGGMTLRDYFAAKAITGLLAGSMADGSEITKEGIECASVASYLIADAMLKARDAQ